MVAREHWALAVVFGETRDRGARVFVCMGRGFGSRLPFIVLVTTRSSCVA